MAVRILPRPPHALATIVGLLLLVASPLAALEACTDGGASPSTDAASSVTIDCTDPAQQLKIALAKDSSPFLEEASRRLSAALTNEEIEAVSALDLQSASEAEVRDHPVVRKAVSIVSPLVEAQCPNGLVSSTSKSPKSTLIKEAYAAPTSSRCLVVSTFKIVLVSGTVYRLGTALCGPAAPACLAAVSVLSFGYALTAASAACAATPEDAGRDATLDAGNFDIVGTWHLFSHNGDPAGTCKDLVSTETSGSSFTFGADGSFSNTYCTQGCPPNNAPLNCSSGPQPASYVKSGAGYQVMQGAGTTIRVDPRVTNGVWELVNGASDVHVYRK